MLARVHPLIETDPLIDQSLRAGAIVVFSVSGGKDSAAATIATNDYLDSLGHDRDRPYLIHADLGRIEWRSTPQQVEKLAEACSLPLITVRRRAGDLISRWQQRFEHGKRRYAELLTYNLVGPFSSSSLRFCTSEMKTHVIQAELR
jgi:tRNA(Ile)-lysidine synthase TilS/MesJ